MSTEQTHDSDVTPVTASDTVEHVQRPLEPNAPLPADPAERYIVQELHKARLSLRNTRIASLVVLLLVGGEMAYVTSTFAQAMRPQAAAEIAEGYIVQQVNDKGPEIAQQLKTKIPELISQTPDYVLKQMPSYREALENKALDHLTQYCQNTAPQLGQHMDNFLTEHKNEIKELVTAHNDTATMNQVGKDLKAQLMQYIQEIPANGESIKSQIDQALVSLQDIEKTTTRLAHAKDLNGQEKKTRRAIAVLAQSIDHVRETHPAAMEAVNTGLSKVSATAEAVNNPSAP